MFSDKIIAKDALRFHDDSSRPLLREHHVVLSWHVFGIVLLAQLLHYHLYCKCEIGGEREEEERGKK